MALPSCAVTVTVSVLDPTLRSSTASPGEPVWSSSFVMTTMALSSFFVAVSFTASIRLTTAAV